MENLIKKIKAMMPTKEQLKGKDPNYAFGYVDATNEAVKLVKDYDLLHNVSNSCHCVIDEDENIVQFYSNIEKAEIGLAEFTKSHPDSIFGIDEISIN